MYHQPSDNLMNHSVYANSGLGAWPPLSLSFTLSSWWRHQMETFSALLAFCVGNSTVSGEFPAQRPVMRSFDVFFDQWLTTVIGGADGACKRLNREMGNIRCRGVGDPHSPCPLRAPGKKPAVWSATGCDIYSYFYRLWVASDPNATWEFLGLISSWVYPG